MDLLAKLYMHAKASFVSAAGPLLPRLWPFFTHTLPSVRLAAMQCLSCVVAAQQAPQPSFPDRSAARSSGGKPEMACAWAPLTHQVLQGSLQHLFKMLVTEANRNVWLSSQAAWASLLQGTPPEALAAAVPADLARQWAAAAATLPGNAITGLPLPGSKHANVNGGLDSKVAGANFSKIRYVCRLCTGCMPGVVSLPEAVQIPWVLLKHMQVLQLGLLNEKIAILGPSAVRCAQSIDVISLNAGAMLGRAAAMHM